MRFLLRLLPLLLLPACSGSRRADAPAAKWEIDEDASLAVALCPHCGEPVARDGTTCGGCGGTYRVESRTIDCPECDDSRHASRCEACEDSGKCAICEGSGAFEGATCPECEGGKKCLDCARQTAPRTCDDCGGSGRIEIR